MLAVRLLEKRGHAVTVAGNGHEALAALERQSFDVVLMDVQMPEMDGLEATAVHPCQGTEHRGARSHCRHDRRRDEGGSRALPGGGDGPLCLQAAACPRICSTPSNDSQRASTTARKVVLCRDYPTLKWLTMADPGPVSLPDPLPTDAAVLEGLAAECRQQGQWLPALRIYDRLIDLGAATAATWCATGNALSELGEYAQAVGAYEQSLRCQPHNPEAHHDLGRVLYKLGDVDRAADHLEQAAGQCDLVHPWLSLATIIPGCPGASPERILEIRQAFARRLTEQTGTGEAERRPVGRRGRPTAGGLPVRPFPPASLHEAGVGTDQPTRPEPPSRSISFPTVPPRRSLPGYVRHPHDRVHDTADLSNGELAERDPRRRASKSSSI